MNSRTQVGDAMRATPPRVFGFIEKNIRRLIRVEGMAPDRVFFFDGGKRFTYRQLIRMTDRVAYAPEAGFVTLRVRRFTACPQCNWQGPDFWIHYNTFHAQRMGWINEEDWQQFSINDPSQQAEYLKPPELR